MRPEEIAHPAEALQDASWFDAEPANLTTEPPRSRPWWVPSPATAFVILNVAAICALFAFIAAHRFVF